MAKTTATKTTRTKKPSAQMTEDGQHAVYDPSAPRDAYTKGDVVFFPKVRNWLNKGALVEAYGRIVSVDLFDGEAPFLEVSFDDSQVRKLNKIDLGKDIRKFMLEVK
jgi:hypothetical protein